MTTRHRSESFKVCRRLGGGYNVADQNATGRTTDAPVL